jgi:hypothetical protein
MALNFPDNPSTGDIYSDSTSGFSYEYNGTVWISKTPAAPANIQELDDISSGFNGSTTTFALTNGGVAVTPANAQQLRLSIGGVLQNPNEDYSISGSNVAFTTPPANGLTFNAVFLGFALTVNTVGDNTITFNKLAPDTRGVGVDNQYTSVGTGITVINFVGAGTTINLDGKKANIFTKDARVDTINGIGTAISYANGTKSPFAYVEAETTIDQNITFDASNAGINTSIVFTVIPNMGIAAGVGVTVGVGKTLVIDVLRIGGNL